MFNNKYSLLYLFFTAGKNCDQLWDIIEGVVSAHNLRTEPQVQLPQNSNRQHKFKGKATVINMWNSRQDGSVMHVLMTHGTVKHKDWFSAGGWSGYVKGISTKHTIFNESSTGKV